MKYTLILCILMYSFVSFASEIQECRRVEGCPIVQNASTLKEYCPTCIIRTVVLPTPRPVVTFVTVVSRPTTVRRNMYDPGGWRAWADKAREDLGIKKRYTN